MTKKITQYYHNLEERDQKALTLLIVVFVVMIIILGLILPAHKYYQTARNNFKYESELTHWVAKNTKSIQAMNSDKQITPSFDRPLLQEVSNTSSTFGIKINRLQPEGSNKLRLWLQKIEFKKVVAWLEELTIAQSLSIDQISIEKSVESGFVNIQITLSQ